MKNSIGNGEAKELICTIHGHEVRERGRGGGVGGRRVQGGGEFGEEKNGTTMIV